MANGLVNTMDILLPHQRAEYERFVADEAANRADDAARVAEHRQVQAGFQNLVNQGHWLTARGLPAASSYQSAGMLVPNPILPLPIRTF